MMNDQATELRKLVLRAMRDAQPAVGPAPRLVLLTSGHRGVGVTSVAVNLAIAMADQGARVVLVDADPNFGEVGRLCGLTPDQTVADVLIGRRDIHEALRLGPGGIQVIPGLWQPGQEPEVNSIALERLMRQLTKLGRHADAVLVDVGNGANELVSRLSSAADDVLVVTTPSAESVMDTYSRIKLAVSGHAQAAIGLLVNRSGSGLAPAEVVKRIDRSCRRFLGHGVELAGELPDDPAVSQATELGIPVLLHHPTAPFAQAIQETAARLATVLPAQGSSQVA